MEMQTQPKFGVRVTVGHTPSESTVCCALRAASCVVSINSFPNYVDVKWVSDILRWTSRLDRLRNDRSRLQHGQNPRDCRKCQRHRALESQRAVLISFLLNIQVIITNGNLEVVDDGLEFVIHAEKAVLDKFDYTLTAQHNESKKVTA